MPDQDSPSMTALVRHRDGRVEKLGAERLDQIDQLCAVEGTLVWVSAASPDAGTIEVLRREFDLHPLVVEDLEKRGQRPKLDAYERQHVIVAYEVTEAASGLSEIHLFIGPGWLVTVTWDPTPLLDRLRSRFVSGNGLGGGGVGELLYAVLDAVVDSYFPELDRLSDRIGDLEDRVLEGDADRGSLREVLAVKRRLLELRRILGPERDVANQLLRRDLDAIDPATLPYYQDLYDHLVRCIDQLDVYRDLLATVLDTRLTVASNSLNAIMKRLTAFTVILMVPTLIAGVYGMNFDHMPELSWPLGYPMALGLMILAVVVSITFFRRRGWF
ncbi:MAG TPA: magnesium/cobalt transporter CorA [Candidatus Limnocylindrales bacterium]|nr:magnesium/cobalt transporter CorA [Candidatus Limnocylindrales bacterium]